MYNFTIKDTVRRGLFISVPNDDIGWHLSIDCGDSLLCIPVDRRVSDHITQHDQDLRAAVHGLPQTSYPDLSSAPADRASASAALQEVYKGWWLDKLSLGSKVPGCVDMGRPDDRLYCAGEHSGGGPCLAHLAVPCQQDGEPFLEATTYKEKLINNRIRRVYDSIDTAVGLSSYRGCCKEQLFQMEQGSSFRIRRSSGPWREAKVLWTGHELKLLPSQRQERRQERRQPQYEPGCAQVA